MSHIADNLRVLLVDDEIGACTNLEHLLLKYVDPTIQIIGFALDTNEAERLIVSQKPDAVFLDIEMINENAFHFLERIAPFDFEIIFVTSYDEFAIRAFKINAIDYILKPISISELKNATQKLKEKIQFKKLRNESHTTYEHISEQVKNKVLPNKITLKNINSIEVVDFKEIYYVEAQRSYSKFFFARNNITHEITMSNSLSEYEDIFPHEMFFRIHRSYLLNCTFIKKILKDSNNIMLQNDSILPVSKKRMPLLLNFLKTN